MKKKVAVQLKVICKTSKRTVFYSKNFRKIQRIKTKKSSTKVKMLLPFFLYITSCYELAQCDEPSSKDKIYCCDGTRCKYECLTIEINNGTDIRQACLPRDYGTVCNNYGTYIVVFMFAFMAPNALVFLIEAAFCKLPQFALIISNFIYNAIFGLAVNSKCTCKLISSHQRLDFIRF